MHVVVGGISNELLNQYSSLLTGCRVLAGPGESTAIDNIFLQAHALKSFSSLAEPQQIVAQSFEIKDSSHGLFCKWDDARKNLEIYH